MRMRAYTVYKERGMAMLEKAILLAVKGHMGQVDKGGHPYILHPLRVMLNCKSTEAKTVAVLHDILEDTPMTAEELRKEGFSEEIIEALQCLTKPKKQDYMKYIETVCRNPLAAQVKYADLTDNMDLSRLTEVTERDLRRVEQYKKAKQRVVQALQERE